MRVQVPLWVPTMRIMQATRKFIIELLVLLIVYPIGWVVGTAKELEGRIRDK